MITLGFKTDRQRLEFESGNVNTKLVQILRLGMEYLSIEYPNIDYELTLTDIFRTELEQDNIYLNANDPEVVKKYKKNPWQSVHQYWRGLDLRTYNMPKGMKDKLLAFFNMITYDHERPEKVTAIYHDLGTGSHIHLQCL